MTTPLIHVSDHAVLRYLERQHGVDVEAIRQHLASLCSNGARFKASGVRVEKVKLLLAHGSTGTTVITALKTDWPDRRAERGEL